MNMPSAFSPILIWQGSSFLLEQTIALWMQRILPGCNLEIIFPESIFIVLLNSDDNFQFTWTYIIVLYDSIKTLAFVWAMWF
jgi:hypothetical protein